VADALFDVVFEDDDLLVVDKPADLVCHPTKDGEMSSLIGRVRLYLGHADGRLVNRLDRETSGLVLVAKNAVVAGDLGRMFGSRQARKGYRAIVHGHMPIEPMTIDAPIGADRDSEVAIKGRVREDGAPAVTRVASVEGFMSPHGPLSIVDVVPETGRKHQIRIHLAHAGYPIVGDKLYGGDEGRYLRFVNRALTPDDARALVVATHCLHAASLGLVWRERERDWVAKPSTLLEAVRAQAI
jgi:23S rRNA pseudouridine1911/1915/1917 synthase